MENFVSNQVIQKETTSGNALNAKNLDTYLSELLTEH